MDPAGVEVVKDMKKPGSLPPVARCTYQGVVKAMGQVDATRLPGASDLSVYVKVKRLVSQLASWTREFWSLACDGFVVKTRNCQDVEDNC